MITKEIKISNDHGLHDRACLKFVNTSMKYACDVFVKCNGNTANGKSFIELTLLSANNYIYSNTSIVLEVNGNDEEKCIQELIKLIENRFEDAEFPSVKIEELKQPLDNFNDYQ